MNKRERLKLINHQIDKVIRKMDNLDPLTEEYEKYSKVLDKLLEQKKKLQPEFDLREYQTLIGFGLLFFGGLIVESAGLIGKNKFWQFMPRPSFR